MESVAIIGIGCRFPGADDPASFWRLLCASTDAISTVPADRWDAEGLYDPDPAAPGKINSKSGGFLSQVDQFDCDFFGIAPREAQQMDPQQRLLLEVAWEALEDAGVIPASLAGSHGGVFMGIGSTNYAALLHREPNLVDAFTNSGGGACIAANRISYSLDLRGPSVAVDGACASSLLAVHQACQSLITGESSLALAGGSNLILVPGPSISLAKARLLSKDGRCRVFDAGADGFGRGEGVGVVVLKLLARALADKDPIYAVIQGTASRHGGRSNGLMAPSRRGQEAVLREAWKRAGIAPGEVQYVEAHSSGTPIGDATELNALGAVLGEGRRPGEKCSIGSVKTNFGHLESAAGIAGLIKVALMIRHRQLAPSLHFQTPNSLVAFDALPLRVQTALTPWHYDCEALTAGVSASSYGGLNVHIALSEAPIRPMVRTSDGPQVFAISARTSAALRDLAMRNVAFLEANPDAPLSDICFTATVGRTHFSHRLAMVVTSTGEVAKKLSEFLAHGAAGGAHVGVAARRRAASATPKNGPSVSAAEVFDLPARFVQGNAVDWSDLFRSSAARKVSLPTYPFQRQRHWIPMPLPCALSAPGPAESCESPSNEAQTQPVGAAPIPDVERILTDIWREVLGVGQLDASDDFFELGGNSVMAIETVTRIEQRLGVRLEPAILFERPTIAQLSQALDAQPGRSAAPPLVTIRAAGEAPPVFLIAPDHLLHYIRLARLIDRDYPLYGLRPPFFEGFVQRGITIEEMATTYLEELCRVWPEGDCHLVGLCAGGVVAYEMAQRLKQSGRRVGLLALLDAPCPALSGTEFLPQRGYVRARAKAHLHELSRLPMRERIRYVAVRGRIVVEAALWRVVRRSRQPTWAKALASISNRSAIYRYRAEPYSGRVDLFLAEEPFPTAREDTRLRWCEPAPLARVHRFPGDHEALLKDPEVVPLAERLNEALRAYSEAQTPDTEEVSFEPRVGNEIDCSLLGSEGVFAEGLQVPMPLSGRSA